MSDFNTQNSARHITQSQPNWKSRNLNMSSRHRGSCNIGDIIPGYWTMVSPKDKVRADARGIFKFFPFYSPAFVDMKVKTEWFYVPLKLIAPDLLKMLQSYKPLTDSTDVLQYMSAPFSVNTGWLKQTTEYHDPQSLYTNRVKKISPPSIKARQISAFLCDFPINRFKSSPSSGSYSYFGSNLPISRWRSSTTQPEYSSTLESIGFEDLNGFAQKQRIAKFLRYLGLPKSLTTMKYYKDMAPYGVSLQIPDPNVTIYDSSFEHTDNPDFLTTAYKDFVSLNHTSGYAGLSLYSVSDSETSDNFPYCYRTDQIINATTTDTSIIDYALFKANPHLISKTANSLQLPSYQLINTPIVISEQPVSILPAQAYQMVYNQFYRDQKIMKDEVRIYSDFYDDICHDTGVTVTLDYPNSSSTIRFFNNVFGLRRRNYEMDLFSSSYDDGNILAGNSSESMTSSNMSLLASIRRFLLKKEMTGSTWAEWLNSFFGTRGSDYLSNNVIYLGGDDSQVQISEITQTSSSVDDSAQGNRSGKADDYHNARDVYFEVPDFGILLCNFTVMPDSPDNFNGLDRRFRVNSPLDFNFPDLQNIGFTPIQYQELNLTGFDRSPIVDSARQKIYFSQLTGADTLIADSDSFGYQPFGFQHTYVPNIISGDLQDSLSNWHQSPDYSLRYSSSAVGFDIFTQTTPRLNLNYRAVGRRFQPTTGDQSPQYYNNIFAVTNDESGDHIVFDMFFDVSIHRKTAFFTTGLPETN